MHPRVVRRLQGLLFNSDLNESPRRPSRRASSCRDEAGVDAPPATWSALPAQLTTVAWIAPENLLLQTSGWRLAANDDGARLAIA